MKKITFLLKNKNRTIKLANFLSSFCKQDFCFFLYGSLGVGKTTFARGFLEGLGYNGNVISPTYNLVKLYQFSYFCVYHIDFYRIKSKEELRYIGIQDLLNYKNIYLIEWPENGCDFIPSPDIKIYFSYAKKGIIVDLFSISKKGKTMIEKLKYFSFC